MADIFVSYANEDRERVRGLVAMLESDGWSVWWDRSLHAGEAWPDVIERELGRATCVVVVWSDAAVRSHWVRLEAHTARRRGILVPVAIDAILPPDEFTVYHTLDLQDYPADPHEVELAELGTAVCTELRRARRRKLMPLVVSLLLLAVVMVGWWVMRHEWLARTTGSVQPSPPENSIAILEFDYRGPAEDGYLARGFGDLLAAQLHSVGYLVASRIAVDALPDNADVAFIRNRLRVRWALDGTLYQSADGMRVSAQLVDLETGYQKSNWSLDAPIEDLVALQNRFARTLFDDLQVPVAASQAGWQISPDTQSDAYLAYLHGLDLLHGEQSLADIDAAQAAFAEALRTAPDFARAHAGMCRAKLRAYEARRSVAYFDAAKAHCERAMSLDAQSVETTLAVGSLELHAGDYAEARQSFEKAVMLDASSADALLGLAQSMEALGEYAAAETNFTRATVVQPGYWKAHNALALFLIQRGRDEEALERFKLALEMVPQSPIALNNLGAALMYADELGLAVKAFDKLLAVQEDAAAYNNLGAVYFLLHDFVGAAQAYERAVKLSPDDYRLHANLADSLAAMDAAGAQHQYERALELAQARLSVNEDDVHAMSGIAAFHAALGHRALALERLARASELAPQDADVHRVAAITQLRLGGADAAVTEIERAVELGYPKALIARDPEFNEISTRRDFLKAVGKGST